MLDLLYQQTFAAISAVRSTYTRELHNQIDWNNRLIGIRGPRGVGKTTLLLQHLKNNHGRSREALYATLDDFFFTETRVIDLAREFHAKGGKVLYLDEVHKYPHSSWAQEIKNIYDLIPSLKVVFTGSSVLKTRESATCKNRKNLFGEHKPHLCSSSYQGKQGQSP